ncbi:MAG: hypothetical protein JST85_27795 [Acidobacteria bacterium]|nr:hypothetical protein [Acidobacteriota bacterium]
MSQSENQPKVVTSQSAAARQTAVIQPNSPATISYDTYVSELPPPKKLAVFVAHGMGQQLKFETLDHVAQGLIEREIAAGRSRAEVTIEPPVVTVNADGGMLHGLRLKLCGDDFTEREVHIFEGYWAPLAEGQVRLHDVIWFLFTAGLNGVRNFGESFDRWLFGEYRKYPSRISLTICLLIALAVVVSLVVMDTALIIVALHAVADFFGLFGAAEATWMDTLKQDLTTTYDVFISLALLFACSLLAGSRARKLSVKSRKGEIDVKPSTRKLMRRHALLFSKAINWVSWVLFALTLGATVLCGVTIPLLFYAHKMLVNSDKWKQASKTIWPLAFGNGFADWLNEGLNYLFVALLLIELAWLAAQAVRKIWTGLSHIDRDSQKVLVGTTAVLAIFIVVVFRLSVTAHQGLGELRVFWQSAYYFVKDNISWGLLIVVSGLVRRLLVQYVGDVALYLTSHTLDRFNSLRDKIRKHVFDAAQVIYSHRTASGEEFEYESVYIMGHSLGSVIAYDALNQLLNEDEIANEADRLQVLERTKLLLTFGSPLDKTAYMFSLQRDKTSLEREALVASSQPLILDPKFRDPEKFEWINIHSHNDIISGRLDFFDPPADSTTRKLINPVRNMVDEEATTLLSAHVEYWENQLVFRKLHEKLTEKARVAQKR